MCAAATPRHPRRQGTWALPYKLDAHFAPLPEAAMGKGRIPEKRIP